MSLQQEGVKFSEFVKGLPAVSKPANNDVVVLSGEQKMAAGVLAKGINNFFDSLECQKITLARGAIDGSSGYVVSSTARLVCNEVFEELNISLPEGYVVHSVAYYSSYKSSTDFTCVGFGAVGTQNAHLYKEGCVLKFTIRKADESEITIEDITNLCSRYSSVSFKRVTESETKIESLETSLNEVFADKIYEQTASIEAGVSAVVRFEDIPLNKGTFLRVNLDGDVFKNLMFVTFYVGSIAHVAAAIPDNGVIPITDYIAESDKFTVSIGANAVFSSGSLKVSVSVLSKNEIGERTNECFETKEFDIPFRSGVYLTDIVNGGIGGGSSDSWESSIIDISKYRGMKIRGFFKSPASIAAKTMFVDKDMKLISYATSDGTGVVEFYIPDNAKYLAINNRVSDIANPFFVLVNKETKNKYLHFSLDDVSGILQNLVDNESTYTSVFEEAHLALLKTWHDTYGIKISLYVQRTMSDIPSKFKYELVAAKDWIKWGYHGVNGNLISADYDTAKSIWNTFVEGVMTSLGDYDVIDRCPRLDYFHCTLDGAKGLRDANCGIVGLLSCDDWAYNKETRATNYYLTDEQSTWLDKHDKFVDNENQLTIVKTDFRLEQIISRWSSTSNCLDDYASANRAGESFWLEIFSHEGIFNTYTTAVPTILQWALSHGYMFGYPMNRII